MEWLINWNASISFPESLSSLEQLLRSWENSSAQVANTVLDVHNWFSILIGVLIIGVLTGFSEELFFRGGLQGLMVNSRVRPWLAIWIAALVFSFMHFQFFGFFPRLIMGAFFGYLLYWTGSLWNSMFAHILNNSVIVVVYGFVGEESLFSMPGEGSNLNLILPILSLATTIIFFLLFRNFFFSSRYKHFPWQKRPLPPITKN